MLNIQLQGGVEQEMVLEIGDDVLVRRKRAAGQTFKKNFHLSFTVFFLNLKLAYTSKERSNIFTSSYEEI